ncbi:MAG: hypothetical protein GY909_01255 [Oligoflexia bacterium]|nr:hypothetical protein [Oligoflexia bacterium]
MINFKSCTEEELWKYVAVHLKKNGIDTTLVGGAVVAVYSKGAYHSGDLDFVRLSIFREGIDEAMNEIGFQREGRHFVHPKCEHLFIEFPGGPPLGIGEDNKIIPEEVNVDGTIIKILSPTDCVKDRLASYIHFKANECLDQAVIVAQNNDINYDQVKKWCKNENSPWAFDDFLKKLKN